MATESLSQQRTCIGCGLSKPETEFQWGSWRTRATGERKRYREPRCKPCKAAWKVAHRKRSSKARESHAEYQRQYRLRDLPTFNARKRASLARNRESHNARCRKWAALNPERRRLIVRICEQARRALGWNKNRRAIRDAITETLEMARVGDKYLDAYSGELIDNPTIDHVVPLSGGGTTSADNLCVTSGPNNSSKFNKPLLVWLVERASP